MTENEKSDFIPVPLPSQTPAPPDLSKVPLSVIHSATMETLLSHNEDLTARLKVQIRRNAVLERKALDLEDSSQQMKQKLQVLEQQQDVFIEKEVQQTEKIRDLQTHLENAVREMGLLEIRYSETTQLQQAKDSENQKTMTDLKARIYELEKLIPLEKENTKIRDENNFFKTKIEELCNYIQKKDDELQSLKKVFNEKIQSIEEKEAVIKKLQQQNEYQQRAVEEKAALENLIILKEREKEHITQQVQHEMIQYKQENQALRSSYKTLQNDKRTVDDQLRRLEEATIGLNKDNAELDKQVQNMQELWYKLQAEFEKEKTKTTALNKLNRELALQLHHKISTTGTEDEYFKKFLLQNRDIEV